MNLNIDKIKVNLVDKMKRGQMVRIIYLGASCTQRRIPGMHWGDWLELACKLQYGGGIFQVFNAGVGGETAKDLLNRLDRDVIKLSPDAVIMTIGGNDAIRNMPLDDYEHNLLTLHRRMSESGVLVIFQTYYAWDLKRLPGVGDKLNKFMQIIRDTAKKTESPFIDQYERWSPMISQKEYVDRLLMDPLHTTELGNLVMGLNLSSIFECANPGDLEPAETSKVPATDSLMINYAKEVVRLTTNYTKEALEIHETINSKLDI